MKTIALVWFEIAHRKLNFLIALLATTLAVASCVGVVTLMDAHSERTSLKVATLNDEIRKITKSMGFNIIILPRDQNLADFYASDFAEKTMPQEFVDRLANSPDIVTINHLRPALIRKLTWEEHNRQVVLMGVSGVVPFAHRDPKKPLSEPVPPGTMNVGHVLADQLNLKTGADVELNGQSFRIGKVLPAQGNKDDITVWIDLPAAQEMLAMDGKINMIQALECNCATIDRLAQIQTDIAALLGDEVQVIEFASIALARAKAREGVKDAGQATIDRLAKLASVLFPVLIIGAGAVVGLLSLANARERRSEIGILRAIGVRSRQIFGLFVSKALIVGILGAAAGFLLGFVGVGWWESLQDTAGGEALRLADLFQPTVFVLCLAITPLLVVAASWLPALVAATQDPAAVLGEE